MTSRKRFAAAAIVSAGLAGCAADGARLQDSDYYGAGWYEPWYYTGPLYDQDLAPQPPPLPRLPRGATSRPTPSPSIPTTPRPGPTSQSN